MISPSLKIFPINFSRPSSSPFVAADSSKAKSAAAGGIAFPAPREIGVGDLVRRLEGRLTIKEKEGVVSGDLSPGKAAVRLVNERLTEATDAVLDKMTLEQLMEQVSKNSNLQQSMYYI